MKELLLKMAPVEGNESTFDILQQFQLQNVIEALQKRRLNLNGRGVMQRQNWQNLLNTWTRINIYFLLILPSSATISISNWEVLWKFQTHFRTSSTKEKKPQIKKKHPQTPYYRFQSYSLGKCSALNSATCNIIKINKVPKTIFKS